MHPYSTPIHRPAEFYDLLDEEFDTMEIKRPFQRKPFREQAVLICDDQSWDDPFDHDDMMYELQE